MEQYLADALPGILAYACFAVLGLRTLAYMRSGFLATSETVVCGSRNTRPNPEVSSTSNMLLLLTDIVTLGFIATGVMVNFRPASTLLDQPLLTFAGASSLIVVFVTVIHHFNALCTVKDEDPIIQPAQRDLVVVSSTILGLLAAGAMLG